MEITGFFKAIKLQYDHILCVNVTLDKHHIVFDIILNDAQVTELLSSERSIAIADGSVQESLVLDGSVGLDDVADVVPLVEIRVLVHQSEGHLVDKRPR